MESKVIKTAHFLLLLLGTGICVYNYSEYFLPLPIKIKSFLIILPILLFLILLFITIKFKIYIDTFYVLYSMSRNNKLHTLRALIFIIYHNIIVKKNHFFIRNGKFTYEITKSQNFENSLNVKYLLELYITKRFWGRFFLNENKTSLYRIFAIIENNYKKIKHTIKISLAKQSELFDLNIPLNPITLSKYDRDLRFAGLGAIEISIPNRMLKMSDITNPIKFICEYHVENQIELKSDKRNYDFVITPRNYGKKMKALNIKLFIDSSLPIMVEVQEISRLNNNVVYKNIDVMIKKGKDSKSNLDEYVLHSNKIRPNMNSIYFVKVQFLDEEEKK